MSNWYYEVNTYCLHVSEAFNIPLIKVAGILSALSPNNKFEQNVKDLERFIQSKGNTKVSTYGAQRDKAYNILHCEIYDENIIKAFLGKGALKTRAFFENIYRPESSTSVTVDLWQIRWAKSLMIIPEKGVLTPKRYRIISDIVKTEAKRLNMLPHEFQAFTWAQLRGEKY